MEMRLQKSRDFSHFYCCCFGSSVCRSPWQKQSGEITVVNVLRIKVDWIINGSFALVSGRPGAAQGVAVWGGTTLVAPPAAKAPGGASMGALREGYWADLIL
jgi:hypothetical protein